jgi:hypothetical protein
MGGVHDVLMGVRTDQGVRPGTGGAAGATVSGADLDRMADRLFLEGRRKQSAF